MPITLTVNGEAHGGWKTARVTRSLDHAAGDFSLTISERWPGQIAPKAIRPGDACVVAVNGQAVITGWVDDVQPKYDATTHEVTFVGRSRTNDLVDCSAIHSPGQWRGLKLEAIAAELAAPFKVSVVAEVSTGAPFPSFSVQQGETVFEAIERMTRMRGVIVTDDNLGNLVITRARRGRASGTLRHRRENGDANNILSGTGTFNVQSRFSHYLVKGQSPGSDNWHGEKASGAKSEVVTDGNIGRYRPLLLVAEASADGVSATDRARWERARRGGKSVALEYRVQGWTQDGSGSLWVPNQLVAVEDDFLGVWGALLVAQVTYEIGASGTTTTMRLHPPEAFELLPEMPEAGAKGSTVKGNVVQFSKDHPKGQEVTK